jgi:hypothetical protein
MMTMCYRFFLLKHKEEGKGNNYHRIFHYNTTIKEDDGILPSSLFSQT